MKKIFREAAQQIDEGRSLYSCNALISARSAIEKAVAGHYARIISPRDYAPVKIHDFESDNRGLLIPLAEAQAHRVIALLMVGQAWNDLKGEPCSEGGKEDEKDI